ncbi:hypothetical protein [Prosthecobacter dejongeii]|uniref:Uncharacterized protein n=1 Tax=Prosthecobacter dejongeii TaxID=48465 RepID=A0A7W7YPR9_9BACT|nr:hypothetical protein [Prosthecobacter dejongeii]MBB5039855.1 hypothetical protein [Prosthecobacter dejongeii]
MKIFALIVGIAVAGSLPSISLQAQEKIILEKPVPVLTASGSEVFPEAWRKEPVSAQGTALSDEKLGKAKAILEAALSKYPATVLKANLKAVYVLSELRYRGVVTSGTNSRTYVYLKMGDELAGYTPAHVEGTFHAEFSSILIRNHPQFLDKKAWQKANPADFQYLGDGVEAVKQGKAGLKSETTLLEKGFLSQYGCSTLENDFNGLTIRLFAGDASLWALAEQYPRIRAKLQLALSFYQRLDPSFTESFFKAQGISRRSND